MRIVVFSDTHRKHDKIHIPDGDALIFCGDMCGTGEFSQVTKFFHFFSKLPHKHKIVIAGNHDFPFELRDPKLLVPRGTSYLCDTTMHLRQPDQVSLDTSNDLIVHGMPWTPCFYNWAFMLPRDSDRLKARVDFIPNRTDILITHGPPKGILDDAPIHDKAGNILVEHSETGCALLREKVESIAPKLHVFGHVHESYGTYRNDKTLFINACVCDGKYEPVNKPIVVDYINNEFKVINL